MTKLAGWLEVLWKRKCTAGHVSWWNHLMDVLFGQNWGLEICQTLTGHIKGMYSDQDLQSNRGKLCDYLVFLKDMELDSAMPQLYKLFSLVATIGATSAGVERSFSCLKRLKSYTRNTMGQGRLSSLALLAIERTLVKSLEKTPSWYDRVTEHFLEKERRAEFTYK